MAAKNAQKAAATHQTPTSESQQQKAQNADALLKADHRKVETLFKQCENADSSEEKSRLAKQICKELIIHSTIEEEIFYPACREKNVEHDMLDEAQVEHDGAKILIAELVAPSPGDEFFDAKVSVLSEYIKHHVGEEEKARSGIFALAQKAGVDMAALGQKIQARKLELMAEVDENRLQPPKPRSLCTQPLNLGPQQENFRMARQSNNRERDEHGRFTSDDHDDRRSGTRSSRSRIGDSDDDRGSYQSRSSSHYDDDDDRRSSGGRSSGFRDRDEQGRFASEDDIRGERGMQSGRSGSRYDDDNDDRRSYGGRSSSSRDRDDQGRFISDDDHRGGRGMQSGRSGNRYDDDNDDRRSYGGRNSNSRDRDDQGRFTSDDDYRGGRGMQSDRSSSRYDGDDEDRRSSRSGRSQGQGWHGDSEGHSEAAQRGWESRGSSQGGRQSGRSDDDDHRSSRGSSSRGSEGQGGWFGDSRGHSEAARRGWRNRD